MEERLRLKYDADNDSDKDFQMLRELNGMFLMKSRQVMQGANKWFESRRKAPFTIEVN